MSGVRHACGRTPEIRSHQGFHRDAGLRSPIHALLRVMA